MVSRNNELQNSVGVQATVPPRSARRGSPRSKAVRIATAVCLLGLLVNVSIAQDKTAKKKDPAKKQTKKTDPAFKTVTDKVSYGLGLNIGNSFNRDGLELNLDLIIKGLSDALNKAEPKLTEEEIREAMATFQTELRAKQEAKEKAAALKNKKEGEAYLAKNKKQKGVITTSLQ